MSGTEQTPEIDLSEVATEPTPESLAQEEDVVSGHAEVDEGPPTSEDDAQ